MDNYQFTIKTVKRAGELLMSLREESFRVMSKDNDPRNIVTSVDRAVGDFIIKKIKSQYPEQGIYSEEGGGIVNKNEYQWTIDPIDGTANFARAIPHFAICLGLLFQGEPILGAVFNPVTKELFSFKKGQGAFLNNKKIKVTSVDKIKDSYVFFHAGRKESLRDWGGEFYKQLLGNVKKTNNFASSSLDTCFIAAGRIEANIYGTLSTLDISSALGILLEAGGVIENEEGIFPGFNQEPQKIFMANNKKVLKSLKKLL